MALTTQDVADVLNTVGMDTTEKFTTFLGQAGPLIQRNALLSQIEKLREDQATANATTQAQIQAINDQIAAIDASLRG